MALFVLAGLTVWLIQWFLQRSGAQSLSEISTTRPLLVITAIMSTVVFGGALLFSSLFTSEIGEQFSERFRHAREIFLVFSGIFGTVIGFYFGADGKEPQQLLIKADAQGPEAVAYVSGGTPPYEITFAQAGARAEMKKSPDGWVRFALLATAKKSGVIIATDAAGKIGKQDLHEPVAPPIAVPANNPVPQGAPPSAPPGQTSAAPSNTPANPPSVAQ